MGLSRLFIPLINRTVKVYVKSDSYIESQEDFKDDIDHWTHRKGYSAQRKRCEACPVDILEV